MQKLIVGDKAPKFTINIADNSMLSLENLAGKFIILYFYPKDNTPGCTVEAKDFNSLLPEFKALKAEVIGVSKDNLKSHNKFRDKYNLQFDLGSDIEGIMCANYGVWLEKSMFGKKYMGINRATFLINPKGQIVYIWSKVSVVGHARAVLNKLQEFTSALKL